MSSQFASMTILFGLLAIVSVFHIAESNDKTMRVSVYDADNQAMPKLQGNRDYQMQIYVKSSLNGEHQEAENDGYGNFSVHYAYTADVITIVYRGMGNFAAQKGRWEMPVSWWSERNFATLHMLMSATPESNDMQYDKSQQSATSRLHKNLISDKSVKPTWHAIRDSQ
ncbi:hypothetical protein DdX_17352 [Ditylenchus destructor]|uniref:Uncharacterized protein n=1 Tax=Ditylenchus destructor TaxID=166010 RepID=A0AAD4MS13_9BILA|nr:hypothetical protein DdX_17352 [Ditylenchus destructor]